MMWLYPIPIAISEEGMMGWGRGPANASHLVPAFHHQPCSSSNTETATSLHSSYATSPVCLPSWSFFWWVKEPRVHILRPRRASFSFSMLAPGFKLPDKSRGLLKKPDTIHEQQSIPTNCCEKCTGVQSSAWLEFLRKSIITRQKGWMTLFTGKTLSQWCSSRAFAASRLSWAITWKE